MATYTVDKIGYNNNEYVLQDSGALQLTGGSVTGPVTFGDSVSADDVSIGTLSVTGSATFTNNIQANKINNVTVGSSPKFTDTVTTVTTSGSGNAITAITASNGAITATKGSTFVTSADIPDVSGKIDTAGTGLSKSGTTLNHSNSVTAQTTQAIYPIKIDAQGHISAYGTAVTPLTASSTLDATKLSGTIPSGCYSDTKVTQTDLNKTNSAKGILFSYAAPSGSTVTNSVYTSSRFQYNDYGPSAYLYNSDATKYSLWQYSLIKFGNSSNSYTTSLNSGTPGSNVTLTLPITTGTLALTSQIPAVTLNGSSTTSPNFYAPTSVGTNGYYLKSNGSGAPAWSALPTIPTAGTSASAVGTTASGGSASTYSKSDHVHNITSTTITTALGYTPYNSTNPNGYTSNTGTVTGVKVNGTTVNPTSGVVDIGTVATSDTKVTQTFVPTSDTAEYPLLISSSTDTSSSITGISQKSNAATFIRNNSDAASLNIGGGNIYLNRFNYYQSDDFTTRDDGLGIGIGSNGGYNNDLDYSLSEGQLRIQHWTAAKESDGSVTTQTKNGVITLGGFNSTDGPGIYVYNKISGSETYSRLRGNGLYINNGTAHMLNATGIDKVNALGTSTTICKTQNYTTAMTGNTWYTFNSFTLAAGTWIVQCTATFSSTSSTGTRIIRLTTGNTSTARVNWNCEATLGTHGNSMNTLTFTTILTPTASTTYYLRAWSSLDVAAHATNNSGFVTYTRLI